jgi:hypothetical protein
MASTVQEYNFTVHQGAEVNVTLTLTESNGSATDLTGYAVRGVVKHRYGDSATLLDLVPSVSAPATSGIISISIPATPISQLPVGQFVYDIEKYPTNNAEAVSKVVKGFFNVHPEATTT